MGTDLLLTALLAYGLHFSRAMRRRYALFSHIFQVDTHRLRALMERKFLISLLLME